MLIMLMKRLNNDDLDNDTSIILRLGVSTVLVRRQTYSLRSTQMQAVLN